MPTTKIACEVSLETTGQKSPGSKFREPQRQKSPGSKFREPQRQKSPGSEFEKGS
jgi:hypothetical protein